MEKVIEIAKNVAIVILALIVAFILFIGLGKLASFAFSSLASAGASLTSVFVPATTTPAIVGGATVGQPNAYATSSATMTVVSQPAQPSQAGSYQAPTTAAAPATAYSYVSPAHPIAPVVTYYGLPDLAATVVSTGIINSAGTFVAQPVSYEGQRVAAVILVTNRGTNVSGSWILQAPLPTNEGGEVFTSVPQASLAPGASTKLTLAFNDLRDVSASSMVVTVDPYNQVAESNKSNNQVVVTFQKNVSSGYGVGYNSGYNYTYPTTYTTNINQDGDVYYSNGSYYVAPPTNTNSCTYPYTNNGYNYGYTGSNCNGSGYGLPDLAISIVSVNSNANSYNSYNTYTTCTTNYGNGTYWNGYTGSNCTGNGSNNTVTAEFQITNVGQSIASGYTFNAGINGGAQYTSPSEPSLAPGQTATYTETLTSPYYTGQNTITATVNPFGSTDANYSNNTVTRSF